MVIRVGKGWVHGGGDVGKGLGVKGGGAVGVSRWAGAGGKELVLGVKDWWGGVNDGWAIVWAGSPRKNQVNWTHDAVYGTITLWNHSTQLPFLHAVVRST